MTSRLAQVLDLIPKMEKLRVAPLTPDEPNQKSRKIA
jgi:hypothetical protein